MKIIFVILLVLSLLVFSALIFLAQQSKEPPKLGLIDGKFKSCLYSTNCVNSLSDGDTFIEPFRGHVLKNWTQLPDIITTIGGEIQQQTDDYLWVTFNTKWIGFVDDMEFLLEEENDVIHVRSSSRVGRSDFGENRRRVEKLRRQIN